MDVFTRKKEYRDRLRSLHFSWSMGQELQTDYFKILLSFILLKLLLEQRIFTLMQVWHKSFKGTASWLNNWSFSFHKFD